MTALDTFDLTAAGRALRPHKVAIFVAALLAGLAVGGSTAVLLKYHSEGVYTLAAAALREKKDDKAAPSEKEVKAPVYFFKGLRPQDLKTEYPQFDADRFSAFLSARGTALDRNLEKVIKALTNAETRQEMLLPVYGTTRADVRELGEQSSPPENVVLGVRIAFDAFDGNEAHRVVELLGDFIGETVFRSQVRGLLVKRLEAYETQALSLENEIIVTRFTMAKMSEKSSRLKGLRQEYPEVARSNPQQVVSVAEGGSRYLSPSAQLVGIESTLADLRQQVATREREQKKAQMLATLYAKAAEQAMSAQSSASFLDNLGKLIDASFALSGDSDDVAREARNDAQLDLYALRTVRSEGLRFISGPTAGKRDNSKIWKFALLGAALAALAAALIVLVFARRNSDGGTV